MRVMRGTKSSNLVSVAIYECSRELDGEVEAISVLQVEYNSNEEKETAKVMKHMEFDGFRVNKKRQSWSYGDLYNIIRDGIDVVLVDIRAGGTVSGVEFSKRITNRNPLTDVLLYNCKGIGPEINQIPCEHASIRAYNDESYATIATCTIYHNLEKRNNSIFLRGLLISLGIDVESLLNEILRECLLVSGTREARLEDIIRRLDLGEKRQLIPLLAKSDDQEKILRTVMDRVARLQKHRNNLAHYRMDPGKTLSITRKDKKDKYDRDSLRKIFGDARHVLMSLEKIKNELKPHRTRMKSGARPSGAPGRMKYQKTARGSPKITRS